MGQAPNNNSVLGLIISPHDPVVVITPVAQDLEHLQFVVQGAVEVIYFFDRVDVMLVNEHGKQDDLPLNILATLVAARMGRPIPEGIRGRVMIVSKDVDDGEFDDVTRNTLDDLCMALSISGMIGVDD